MDSFREESSETKQSSDSNSYLPSQAEVAPQRDPGDAMPEVVVVIVCTLGACVVAWLVGALLSYGVGNGLPALVCAAVVPAAGAYVGGIRDRKQLLKIALLTAITWYLAYLLRPRISGIFTPTGILRTKLWWIGIAFVPASLMALTGAVFACLRARHQDGQSATIEADD